MKLNSYKKLLFALITFMLVILVFTINNSAYAAQLKTPIVKSFSQQEGESNALRIEFDSNNQGSDYSIEILNATINKTYIMSGSANYYVYQNLSSNQKYTVLVRACQNKAYSCSKWSNQSSAITNGGLKTPTISSIQTINNTSLKINYNVSEQVTGVEILNITSGKTTKTTNKSSYTLNNLKTNTNYSFKIRTYKIENNKTIYSNYSNTKTYKTINTSLKTPTLKFSSVTYTTIKLKYKTKGKITGVQIKNITTKETKNIKAKNTYTWKNLKPGKTYKFKIRSYYRHGNYISYSSWSKTYSKKTDSISKKVNKLKKYSSYKVIKSYSTSNMKKVTLIKSGYSEKIPQAFCDDGSHYIVQFSRHNSDSYGRLISYTKKGKKLKEGPALNLGHANGVACGKGISKIYSVNRGGTRSTIINKSTFKKSGTKTLPGGAYSIAYDNYTDQYYIEGGGTVRVLNKKLKQIKSFKVKKNHPHTQDAGAYHGIFMQGYTDSKYGSNYIDLYRVKDGAYLGSYKVKIGELESVLVDNGYLVLLINIKDSPNAYIYKSKYKVSLP